MFETFDHTADLGLRIRAPDLPSLMTEAARALFSAIVENLDAVESRQEVRIDLPPDSSEFLLFDWLNRLLYHFDSEHLLFSRFRVNLDGTGLHALAEGEPLDRERHVLTHEVKAITYHGLKVEPHPEGWQAELIVDI